MRILTLIIAGLLLANPALALGEPYVWRDETGCAYLLTPQGGITPRLRRDGLHDCPEARGGQHEAIAPIIRDETMRDLSQDVARGLDALKREVERLGDRFGRR